MTFAVFSAFFYTPTPTSSTIYDTSKGNSVWNVRYLWHSLPLKADVNCGRPPFFTLYLNNNQKSCETLIDIVGKRKQRVIMKLFNKIMSWKAKVLKRSQWEHNFWMDTFPFIVHVAGCVRVRNAFILQAHNKVIKVKKKLFIRNKTWWQPFGS